MKTPKENFPKPPTNILRDQLKAQRRELIAQVMTLREQRNALKGVKGTGEQWTLLCEQIDAVQDKIDLISRSLGLPVKERHHSSTPTPNRTNRLFRANRMGRRDDYCPERDPKLQAAELPYSAHAMIDSTPESQEEEYPMILNDEDLDAWDRFNSDVDGNK